MKLIANMLEKIRPQFEEGGKLQSMRPIFLAADNFFFSHLEETPGAPHVRDPLDIKRYMSFVIVALLPAFLASLYYFGPRVLLLVMVSYVAGGIVEVLFAVVRKEEINEGFLVTGFIYPLILPPGLPLWMAAVGIIFGVLVGKEVFGGTGRNPFNAALVGRCFLAFGYPATMTATWVAPGLHNWTQLPGSLAAVATDGTTTATPLVLAKGGTFTSLTDLFLGNVPGSVGETSALAIILGGAFLVLVGVANWRTVVATLGSFVVLTFLLHLGAPARVPGVPFNLLSGGILFGAFFMATDPVTGPVTRAARWPYGILIGALTVVIRGFSGYVEGVMFAILFGNICAPLFDEIVIRLHMRRYAREG